MRLNDVLMGKFEISSRDVTRRENVMITVALVIRLRRVVRSEGRREIKREPRIERDRNYAAAIAWPLPAS